MLFAKIPLLYVTPAKAEKYKADPEFLPVKEYPSGCRPSTKEFGMLVKRSTYTGAIKSISIRLAHK